MEVTGGAPEDISHSYYLSDEQALVDETLDDVTAMDATPPPFDASWAPKRAKKHTFPELKKERKKRKKIVYCLVGLSPFLWVSLCLLG